jgi:hypothetical protein
VRKKMKYKTAPPAKNIYGLVHALKEVALAAARAWEASGSGGMGITIRILTET